MVGKTLGTKANFNNILYLFNYFVKFMQAAVERRKKKIFEQ